MTSAQSATTIPRSWQFQLAVAGWWLISAVWLTPTYSAGSFRVLMIVLSLAFMTLALATAWIDWRRLRPVVNPDHNR